MNGFRALDGASMRTAVRTMALRKLVDGGNEWFLPVTSTSSKSLFTVPIGHLWSGAVSNGKRPWPDWGSRGPGFKSRQPDYHHQDVWHATWLHKIS
jgi:hypothetical protein